MPFIPKGYVTFAFLSGAVLLATMGAWNLFTSMDALFWPQTGRERIEWMASSIQTKKRPTTWCRPSNHPKNTYEFNRDEETSDIGRCLSSIKAASDFRSDFRGNLEPFYLKRFYRGEIGGSFCEVTLSTFEGNDNTFFGEDRIVGSECYFGIFPKTEDVGIGMTDDKFG